MSGEIRETVIMIDHDLGEVRVDSSYLPMVKKLGRLGFVNVSKSPENLYQRFTGRMDQVVVRKGKRVVSEKARKAAAKRLEKGRNNGKGKREGG